MSVMTYSLYMSISSINSFAARWLLLCLIIPSYSGAERSDWVPYEIDPVYYRFRPTQPEPVSVEEQFHPNIPKPPQYNDYHPKYNSVQSRISLKERHSESNVKLNAARSMPENQLGEVYRSYYYSQSAENRGTSKEESAARLERKKTREIDEEIMKKMNMLDKMLSEENDIEKNTVEDGIIAEMNISEETKRVVRQVRRRRPGFFWTLARLTFETYNDTRSAIQQISNIINQSIEPDPTTLRPVSSHPLIAADATTTIAPSIDQNNTSSDVAGVNATTTTSTTQAPFRLTPTNLQNLIRRNLRGLVRLFNIEWQDALNQSDVNVREFQKDLGNQVGSFLQDNPNAF
ncbi:uncharacterized protein [Temnothorax longispinosus]|uniref:uncharacterized protein isoform X1 n=2 Tax=Temnothorax longispinosus TaxID=300112 RepID=UPI003A9A430E